MRAAASRLPLWALCLLVAALEGAVVLGLLGLWHSGPLGTADAFEYDVLARNLLAGHGFSANAAAPFQPDVLRAPGYPALLVALRVLGLGGQPALRVVQLAMLAATGALAGRAAGLLHGARAGRIAALLCVTYLPLVWMTTWQMTEVAAALLLAAFALAAVRAQQAAAPAAALRLWAAAGAILAAAAYVRPSFFLLAAPAALAVLAASRRPLAIAVFCVAFALPISPWTARNLALTGHVVPLAAGGGGSLYASAEQYAGRISFSQRPADWLRWERAEHRMIAPYRARGFAPRDQLAYDQAFGAAAAWSSLSAGQVAARLPDRLAHLWGPADATQTTGIWQDPLRRLAAVQWALLAALTLAGLLLAARRRVLLRGWPLWLPAAYLTGVHLVFHVEQRYTVPARPLLLPYAALGALAAARALSSRSSSARRGAGAGATPTPAAQAR